MAELRAVHRQDSHVFQLAHQLHHAPALFALGRFHFAFAGHAGLLVMLPFAQFGWQSGLLAFLLESLQCVFDRLAIFNVND